MPKISTMLWFDGQAEEAANFYVGVFPNSRITSVMRNTGDAPGEKGSALVVAFELDGAPVSALNGGPMFTFSEAVSFVVHCKDQAEVDYYWEHLMADGGQPSQCGWLKDRFGFSWQVTPDELLALIGDPDPAKASRAMQAMMTMQKIDLAKLREAVAG